MGKGRTPKRTDSNRIVLKTGESQRKNGTYMYRWIDVGGTRRSLYGKTLDELRKKENEVRKEEALGMKSVPTGATINAGFEKWIACKKGIRDSTRDQYIYLYNLYIREVLGNRKIKDTRKSDIRSFILYLHDEKNLSWNSVKNCVQLLSQIFEIYAEDEYINVNPCRCVMKGYSDEASSEKPRANPAFTIQEQEKFLEAILVKEKDPRWKRFFPVLLGTGMRIGEITGLQWDDVDFDNGLIYVRHSLAHKANGKRVMHKPKTKAGEREIPMFGFVREALDEERKWQTENDIHCLVPVDGYDDFVFLSRSKTSVDSKNVLKKIHRICDKYGIRARPDTQSGTAYGQFSCHSFRHTFATRLFESEVSPKTIQELLGHTDIGTTMNTYTSVTREHKINTVKERDVSVLGGTDMQELVYANLTPKLTPKDRENT